MKGKDRYMVLDANIRKPLIIATVAMMALAGCTDEQFEGAQPDNSCALKAIQMGTATKAVTRADKTGEDAAGILNNNYIVEGFKSDGVLADALEVFRYYNVNYYPETANSTESNSECWEYVDQKPVNQTPGKIDVYKLTNDGEGVDPVTDQTVKYWDNDYAQFDFIAFSQGKGTGTGNKTYAKFSEVTRGDIGSRTKPAYKIRGTVDELGAAYIADLITVYRDNMNYVNSSPVTPRFRKVAARVRMAIYETVPGYSVKDVRFYQSASEDSKTKGDVASLTTTPMLLSVKTEPEYKTSDKTIPSGSGTLSVFFPVVGSGNINAVGYNKAIMSYTPDAGDSNTTDKLSFNNLVYGAKEEDEEDGGYLGRTSNYATFAGEMDVRDYIDVIPTGKGHVLKLRVAYTLVPTDGGDEEIVMEDAMAIVPAKFADWQPNYAYTYIFKISEKSGEGLYPITFDALVMDSEDGIQETITEVSDPSITTYQKGRVVTENDEYVTDEPIFVVVGNGLDLSGKSRLFAAEFIPGSSPATAPNVQSALQGVTEATVENCFDYGLKDDIVTPTTWTVTDAAGATLILTDATSSMTVGNSIAALYTTDSITWNVNNAKFSPNAVGYYVFQYELEDAEYTKLTEGTVIPVGYVYYTKSGDVYNAVAVADEAKTIGSEDEFYRIATPAKYAYKVIKVVEAPASTDISPDIDMTDIQGAKRLK